LGEGNEEVLTLFDLGSSAGFAAGPCLEAYLNGAFLLEPGLEQGVLSDVGGLVSVEACSLPTTGEACLGAAVSDPFVGEPSGEDTISSITGGPYLEALLFLGRPLSSQPIRLSCRFGCLFGRGRW